VGELKAWAADERSQREGGAWGRAEHRGASSASGPLVLEDGTPADPPTLQAAVPNWRAGDVIALGTGRALCVVDRRLREDSDGDPVMVLVVTSKGAG
jgi:hypothetical protein